jgi:hypothetical protein
MENVDCITACELSYISCISLQAASNRLRRYFRNGDLGRWKDGRVYVYYMKERGSKKLDFLLKQERIKLITRIQETFKNIKPTRVKPRKKFDYEVPERKTVKEILAHAMKNRCEVIRDPVTGSTTIRVPNEERNTFSLKNI